MGQAAFFTNNLHIGYIDFKSTEENTFLSRKKIIVLKFLSAYAKF